MASPSTADATCPPNPGNSTYGKDRYRLGYLWYDVPGHDGARHRDEIDRFAAIAAKDGILFHATSYQELILALAANHRHEHSAYIAYITDRYL